MTDTNIAALRVAADWIEEHLGGLIGSVSLDVSARSNGSIDIDLHPSPGGLDPAAQRDLAVKVMSRIDGHSHRAHSLLGHRSTSLICEWTHHEHEFELTVFVDYPYMIQSHEAFTADLLAEVTRQAVTP